jgi:hypothetical protein
MRAGKHTETRAGLEFAPEILPEMKKIRPPTIGDAATHMYGEAA